MSEAAAEGDFKLPITKQERDEWFSGFEADPRVRDYGPLLTQAREGFKLVEASKKSIEDKADRLLVVAISAAMAIAALMSIGGLHTWQALPSFILFLATAICSVLGRRPRDWHRPVDLFYALETWIVNEPTMEAWLTAAVACVTEDNRDVVNDAAYWVEAASWTVVLAISGLTLLAV